MTSMVFERDQDIRYGPSCCAFLACCTCLLCHPSNVFLSCLPCHVFLGCRPRYISVQPSFQPPPWPVFTPDVTLPHRSYLQVASVAHHPRVPGPVRQRTHPVPHRRLGLGSRGAGAGQRDDAGQSGRWPPKSCRECVAMLHFFSPLHHLIVGRSSWLSFDSNGGRHSLSLSLSLSLSGSILEQQGGTHTATLHSSLSVSLD